MTDAVKWTVSGLVPPGPDAPADLAGRARRRVDVRVGRARAHRPYELVELARGDPLAGRPDHVGRLDRAHDRLARGRAGRRARAGRRRVGRGLAEPGADAARDRRPAEVDVRLRDGALEVLVAERVVDRIRVDLGPEPAVSGRRQ